MIDMVPTLPKPAMRAPCNGCGICCFANQCALSCELFGEQELCPAIEPAGASFACGLMIAPGRYLDMPHGWQDKLVGEAFALMLGAGQGCDAGEVEDEEQARAHFRALGNLAIEKASPEARMLVNLFRGGEPT